MPEPACPHRRFGEPCVECRVDAQITSLLASRRNDPDFAARLAHRMIEDGHLLDRIAGAPEPMHPARRERMEKRVYYALLRRALGNLPMGLYIGANRYDTDDHHVLHLWTEDGQSFDVTWAKDDLDAQAGVSSP